MSEGYITCKACGVKMNYLWPIWKSESKDSYCYDCAFKLGLVSESEYIHCACFSLGRVLHAGINPSTHEIELLDRKNQKFSWQKSLKDYRHTKQYSDWRKAVFERDNFTCQDCGQHGGYLEAHHIKSFKKYPKFRFDVKNGVTLCRACHLKRHRRGEHLREM